MEKKDGRFTNITAESLPIFHGSFQKLDSFYTSTEGTLGYGSALYHSSLISAACELSDSCFLYMLEQMIKLRGKGRKPIDLYG